ncbi:putative E3 ubiquitin-protein ligase RING1a [Andrographis paniculata]|uniref:putative E3 ubiquitin-protein ligase RING1a n=1 Tax=Andrographis paniculata TaxID=175694 RepID=UPI0021E8A801|nr:putative E3 ubiquitin-protein ligase RING1a [Andrographis paniculata]
MPAQKRSLETTTPSPSPPPSLEPDKPDDSLKGSENQDTKEKEDACDSDESRESSDGEKDEFIAVKLGEIRKEVQCPICLGIIRKTRTVMECLHRFCRECIDKSMRLGNNECPACRTHCASRRSLRDDPNFDALIAALYPDIDKYEEEELAFHEEEKARYKQIQASIAQTFRRQAEALGKKRTSARLTAASIIRRQNNYRNLRGRRNHQVAENHGSEEEEGAHTNDGGKDSSSADERCAEVKFKRYKRSRGARASQQASGSRADGNNAGNGREANKELLGASPAVISSAENLAWGRGGLRSNNRHGGIGWAGGKLSRNNRIAKLVNHLESLNENNELKVSLKLVSLLKDNIPHLKRPYLCCSTKTSVGHLCQYVAMQTSTQADEIEMLIVKDCDLMNNQNNLTVLNSSDNQLQQLNEHLLLGEIRSSFSKQNLVFTYRKKPQS